MARQYEDSETRRLQVAQAALQVIATEGAGRFTTRAVANRVGIGEGTLFRHFGSKEEIALAAMTLLEQELAASLVETGDAMADVEAFFRHRAAMVGQQSSVGRLIFSDELVHLAGEAGRARIDGWRRRNVAWLIQRLVALQAQGELRADVDAQMLATMVQGLLLTFAMQASLGRAGSPAEVQARIELSWSSLLLLLKP